jgi:hypothetical protein
VIKQGPEEKYLPTLYIGNIRGKSLNDFTSKLNEVFASLPYDSLQAEPLKNNSFKINIPSKYRITHEEHFGQVTEKFLEYMATGKIPEWEISGMLTKYYTTTSALKKAME